LAIVRHLVEAHGGAVQAESAGRDKGSTFTVTLPLMKGRPQHVPVVDQSQPPPGSVDRDLRGARILLVEDDPGTRESLSEMLRMSGADVRTAETAAQALRVLDDFTPEILVCDIVMPDQDGYSLLRQIRARGPERGGDVPALALTALAGEEDRSRALAAGFQVHMAKPVEIDRLTVALLALLRRRTPSAGAEAHAPGP
jgi:CheY-like chemotaxis protein